MKKIIATFLLLVSSQIVFSEIISIPNINQGLFHPKEDTETIYFENANSKAVLVFLPGGEGSFGTSPGSPPLERFFFLTSIAKGLNQGVKLDFVFMDSPYVLSPMNTKSNLGIRESKDHLDRIKSTVLFYAKKTNKPIWLIGHSNGAYSLSSFLNQAPENQKLIKGAIFSSGRIERILKGSFNLPILILHHEADSCPYTTYESAKNFYEEVKGRNRGKTEFVTIIGGTNDGEACFAGGSHHMFGGSYRQFNEATLKFISEN
jgi:pimeloyl-ACP methyl ester carboxylesterase